MLYQTFYKRWYMNVIIINFSPIFKTQKYPLFIIFLPDFAFERDIMQYCVLKIFTYIFSFKN